MFKINTLRHDNENRLIDQVIVSTRQVIDSTTHMMGDVSTQFIASAKLVSRVFLVGSVMQGFAN